MNRNEGTEPDLREKEARRFLESAASLSRESPCLRRKFGAIITARKDGIEFAVGIGCNEPPRGFESCKTCLRDERKIPPSLNAEICYAVHAEQNAILNALYRYNGYLGNLGILTLYVAEGENGRVVPAPWKFRCTLCSRMILTIGITFLVRAAKDAEAKDGWKPVKVTARQALEDSYEYTLKAYEETKKHDG